MTWGNLSNKTPLAKMNRPSNRRSIALVMNSSFSLLSIYFIFRIIVDNQSFFFSEDLSLYQKVVMWVSVSGEITFIASRLTIDEAYLAFLQGEATDYLIFGLLDFFLSLVELCLGGSPLLESGKIILILRVKVDVLRLKPDKWIDVSCNNKVIIFEVLCQHIYCFFH